MSQFAAEIPHCGVVQVRGQNQGENKSMSQYMAKLHRLADRCMFTAEVGLACKNTVEPLRQQ